MQTWQQSLKESVWSALIGLPISTVVLSSLEYSVGHLPSHYYIIITQVTFFVVSTSRMFIVRRIHNNKEKVK